jgi:hypothetical protein
MSLNNPANHVDFVLEREHVSDEGNLEANRSRMLSGTGFGLSSVWLSDGESFSYIKAQSVIRLSALCFPTGWMFAFGTKKGCDSHPSMP